MNIAGRKIAQTIEELSFVTSVPKMFAECFNSDVMVENKKDRQDIQKLFMTNTSPPETQFTLDSGYL